MVTIPIYISREVEQESKWDSMGLPDPDEKDGVEPDSEVKNFNFLRIDYFYEEEGRTLLIIDSECLVSPWPTKKVIKEMKRVGFVDVPTKIKNK